LSWNFTLVSHTFCETLLIELILRSGSNPELGPEVFRKKQGVLTMSDWKRNARASVAGLMLVSMTTGAAFGYPEDKDKPKSDLTSVLEKVPPEVREKIKAEMDKIRAEAEKVRNQAMEIQKDARIKGERIQRDAMQRAEEIQRDAKVQIERVQNEVRRAMEARDKQAHHNHGPDGGQRNEVRREMRVEVRKEGDGEPQVQIFENGKPVQGNVVQGQPGMKLDVQMHPNHPPEMDLSKLPPEKREVIEKARKEFKDAEGKLKAAAEKLAKAEGRDHSNVVILRADGPGSAGMMAHGQVFVIPADGQPPIDMRGPGLRLPNIPLPPGVGLSDRMPRPPAAGPGNPELEKRVSKAEKALDDILDELKKLRDDDDDDDEDEPRKEHKGKDKKKKS
jgi:gas vesicle protein